MATEIFRDPDKYEIIGGKNFIQLGDTFAEGIIKSNLNMLIGFHARKNKLGCQFCNLELDFSPENIFRSDFVYYSASNPKTVFDNVKKTIAGVPDMVAEIFSRSTMKRDMGIKKDIYERNGVKEYWMIDPWRETVEVYILRDGKYRLDDVYHNYSAAELNELTDEERAEIKNEIPVDVLDGFKIKIKNIFGWYFES